MTEYIKAQNFIDGQFVGAASVTEVENPATLQMVGAVPNGTAEDVNAAVTVAKAAQVAWAEKPAIERAAYLREIAARLREKEEYFAHCLSTEQGKTIELARGEVAFTHQYFDYTAEWARRIEGEIITSDRPGEQILLYRKPIGVVAGI